MKSLSVFSLLILAASLLLAAETALAQPPGSAAGPDRRHGRELWFGSGDDLEVSGVVANPDYPTPFAEPSLWPTGLRRVDGDDRPQVWIAPDSETPDLVEMFQQPELWAESRQHIKVIKFGPRQVALGGKPAQNSIDDLARVDAFRKLESWGIAIAVEAPAIKPWDCTAARAREMTANAIRSVKAAGGRLRYIAMDEPWTAGIGPCHDTFDGSVAKTADYIKQLSNDPDLAAQGLTPEVGDIETYPAHSPAEIERWISELDRRGAKPKFFHLDVNVHRLDVDRTIDVQRDLREIARFLQGEHIPFGVILWPGYNPVPSDRSFRDLTLSWTRRVGQAIGRPDQVIVQSWVVRGGAACSLTDPSCNMTHPHCAPADGPQCGKHSVPLNLPDNDPSAFALTRTALDALRVLR